MFALRRGARRAVRGLFHHRAQRIFEGRRQRFQIGPVE